jgi:hypothetical protein
LLDEKAVERFSRNPRRVRVDIRSTRHVLVEARSDARISRQEERMVSGVGGPPGGGGKIGGPGAPDPAAAAEAPDAAQRTQAGEGARFGDALERTGRAEAPSAASATSPLERLRAGEIDTKQYVDLRVSDATAHLEGVLAPADLEKIRADLHELIEHDPDVAALVKSAEIGR